MGLGHASVIAQLGILLFGISAMWLVNDHRAEVRKWASVLGLCGQGFWFYETFTQEQWGIFAMCFLYTASWARGYYNAWWRGSDGGVMRFRLICDRCAFTSIYLLPTIAAGRGTNGGGWAYLLWLRGRLGASWSRSVK